MAYNSKLSSKSCLELSDCPMKCKDRFKDKVRKEIFDTFWAMVDRNRRSDYLNGLITTQGKKRKGYVILVKLFEINHRLILIIYLYKANKN